MSLIARQLQETWDALRASNRQRRSALLEVHLRNLRGIRNLRVPFNYPVCVLAGPNGCGKSTVLCACACAYRAPSRASQEFTPSSFFPNFRHQSTGEMSDPTEQTELEFYYLHEDDRLSMVWKRGKSWKWHKGFMGRRAGYQPQRHLYLRALANLTNPSEIRGILQLARKPVLIEPLTSDLLIFAHRILRHRYRRLAVISGQSRNLLFAEVEGSGAVRYSEFHMSSGERTILRISKDIARLENALILIDDIDTGLHPYTQQQLMLELQRTALRQRLQIVVASHSPVILDSVPPEGRIFLDRDEQTGEVRLMPAYRDIFQKSLYGQSRDQLSILCEDAITEGVILGVLDVLQSQLDLRPDHFVIGSNTRRDEFPSHIRTLGKFGKLKDFVVVLDGDSRPMEASIKSVAEEYGHRLQPLFLPGTAPPEDWIWRTLQQHPQDYATLLELSAMDMAKQMRESAQMMEGTTITQQPASKANLEAFAARVEQPISHLGRIVGRCETEKRPEENIAELLEQLKEQINSWRRL